MVDDVSQGEMAWELLEKSEFMSTSHQSYYSFLFMPGVVLLLSPMSKRPCLPTPYATYSGFDFASYYL